MDFNLNRHCIHRYFFPAYTVSTYYSAVYLPKGAAMSLPITDFDILTLDESMHMFKAMLPFLSFEMQKPMSMIIRMNEFTQTMDYYNNPLNRKTLTSQSTNNPFSNEEFLNTVMKYCPKKYAGILENIRNFSKMSDIMSVMNLFNEFDDKSNGEKKESQKNNAPDSDLFKAILTPKQQEEYAQYIKQLSNLSI
jgi:hypothetical protein